MRYRAREDDVFVQWDVARPSRPSRLPGVAMAGFCDRRMGPFSHRAIPHPAVMLAVGFGDGPVTVADATGRQRDRIAVGMGFEAIRVSGENIACVQIRLSPVVAYSLLGVSPAELAGTVINLDDLFGRDAARLAQRLHDTTSWQERFAHTDAFLSRRYATGRCVDPEVAWAWEQIVGNHGPVRVGELATEVGWSRKRLWTRFRAQLGLAPKRAATLVRFDRAAHRLADGEAASRVAAETGYVDQSHLHRDVMAFAGTTPANVAGESWLSVDDTAWASGYARAD